MMIIRRRGMGRIQFVEAIVFPPLWLRLTLELISGVSFRLLRDSWFFSGITRHSCRVIGLLT